MGILKTVLIIVGIILLVRQFAPETYGDGREYLTDTVINQIDKVIETNHTFTTTSYGKDYGKITKEIDCVNNQQCMDFFGVDQMKCSEDGTCYIMG